MTDKNVTAPTTANTATARQSKKAYRRPTLVRYGELASLTQGGSTASTSEFFATFYAPSGG